MSIGTRLYTMLKGNKVGEDRLGNVYYSGKDGKRWVMYTKGADASAVCPEWHAWLHHTADKPLTADPAKEWLQDHYANATGTDDAYFPPAYINEEPKKPAYDAWRPGTAQHD